MFIFRPSTKYRWAEVAALAAEQAHGASRSVREARMRLALIALVTVAAGLTADIRTAAAQAAESFFQERY